MPREACIGASQAVLGPNGFDLIVGREFAVLGLRERSLEGRFLVGGQPHYGLIVAGQLHQNARKSVLRFRRRAAQGLDGLFEQLGHL
jgi:hypothetical protein